MLQYALLHLFGYKLSIDDLKAFRVSYRPILRVPRLVFLPLTYFCTDCGQHHPRPPRGPRHPRY